MANPYKNNHPERSRLAYMAEQRDLTAKDLRILAAFQATKGVDKKFFDAKCEQIPGFFGQEQNILHQAPDKETPVLQYILPFVGAVALTALVVRTSRAV